MLTAKILPIRGTKQFYIALVDKTGRIIMTSILGRNFNSRKAAGAYIEANLATIRR